MIPLEILRNFEGSWTIAVVLTEVSGLICVHQERVVPPLQRAATFSNGRKRNDMSNVVLEKSVLTVDVINDTKVLPFRYH
eukprot:SAG31_NODE_163_length_21856_cov_7.550214_8_plen_80_part_00